MTAALEAYRQAHLLTEAELQGIIIRMAQERGWMVKPEQQGAQTRNSRVRAPQNKSAKGFPDLVLARDEEVLFIEVKDQHGVQSIEQVQWMCALPRYEVIRPSDLARGRVDELLA